MKSNYMNKMMDGNRLRKQQLAEERKQADLDEMREFELGIKSLAVPAKTRDCDQEDDRQEG